MTRYTPWLIVGSMVVIAFSLSAVLYLSVGMQLLESAWIGVAGLLVMVIVHMYTTRSRDSSGLATRLDDIGGASGKLTREIESLNLRMIHTLKSRYFETPIGYSGHEVGLSPTWAAVAMGATFVERHLTLDRAMWGTDQAASVEVTGFHRLVANIRDIERSLGDGVKRVYDSELPVRRKLRRVASLPA